MSTGLENGQELDLSELGTVDTPWALADESIYGFDPVERPAAVEQELKIAGLQFDGQHSEYVCLDGLAKLSNAALCAIQSQDPPHVRRAIVERHTPFVAEQARTHFWRRRKARTVRDTVEEQDVIQSGIAGLLEGASKYNVSNGTTFMSFVGWRVIGSIKDELDDNAAAFTIPQKVVNDALGGRLTNQRAVTAQRVITAVDSLDASSKSDEGGELSALGDRTVVHPLYGNQSATDTTAELVAILSTLTDDEGKRDSRYGPILVSRLIHKATLEEVGEVYGVSKERIRQLESKAKDALRLALETAA